MTLSIATASILVGALKVFLNLSTTLLAPMKQGADTFCYHFSTLDSELTVPGPRSGPTILPMGYTCELLDKHTRQTLEFYQTAAWGPTLDTAATVLAVLAILFLARLVLSGKRA